MINRLKKCLYSTVAIAGLGVAVIVLSAPQKW